jgi:hypothetical protein
MSQAENTEGVLASRGSSTPSVILSFMKPFEAL